MDEKRAIELANEFYEKPELYERVLSGKVIHGQLSFMMSEEELKELKARYIIVNGVRKGFSRNWITYKQVVTLAFGEVDEGYTVTYSNGKGENGSLAYYEDFVDAVEVESGMVFNVTRTDNA